MRFFLRVLLGLLPHASPALADASPASASELPARVAAIEYGPRGARPVVFQVMSRRMQWMGDWRQDASVAHLSWSPDGAFLFYRQAGELLRHDLNSTAGNRTLATELAPPRGRPDYVLRPDGQQLALRRTNSQIELMSLSTVAGATGSSKQVEMPSECYPSRLQWQSDGRGLWVLCTRAEAKAAPLLVHVDSTTAGVQSQEAPGIADLLGWSPARGLLAAGKADAFGQRPGQVRRDGLFQPLSPEPSVSEKGQESPPLDFVQGYLPSQDLFVMARASEDPADPVLLTLRSPGDASGRRWLKAFPRVGSLSFGGLTSWVSFVERKPSDREDVGDLYLVRVGKEDARWIARSNARQHVFYGAPVPEPGQKVAK